MGSYMNPLVGSGWNNPQANPMGMTNPISLPQNAGGTNFWGGSGQQLGNPGNFTSPADAKLISRNIGINNVIAGQLKNMLAPQFASMMGRSGGDAAKFYEQLMNLGSPFYKQHQTEAFNQGVQQNQNAAAQARQQLASQGYGATPSGANAAMIGGMAQQGSQNLAEQYLQNLFANEQMQAQGAQGLFGVAQLFNPTQLLGGTSIGSDPYGPMAPNAFQNFATVMGALSGGGQAAAAMKGAGF